MIVDSEKLLEEVAQAITPTGNWGSMAAQFIRAFQPSAGAQVKQAKKGEIEAVVSDLRHDGHFYTADLIERLQAEKEEAKWEDAKWPDDLESGFLYAMEVAAISGADPGLLDAMRAEWKINHSPENESECFHCGRMRKHFVERDEKAEAELAAVREDLARLIMGHGFATGHGDTHDDLLAELSWQIQELRASHETELAALRADARGKV